MSCGEGEGSGDESDREGAELTGAAVVGRQAGSKGDKYRQRLHRKRKQQPAQKHKADKAEDDADNDHGGGLRDTGPTDTPSTTSAAQSWNSKSVSRLESGIVVLSERRG